MIISGCSPSSDDPSLPNREVETRVAATLESIATSVETTAPSESVPETGFTSYPLENGSTVDIPDSWISLTLDEETLEGISTESAEILPEFSELIGGDEQLAELYKSGLMLIAIDNDLANVDFSANVNILREKQSNSISMNNYMKLTGNFLTQAGFIVKENSVIQIGGTDVGVLISDIESPELNYTVAQHIWFEGDYAIIVTMSYTDRDDYYLNLAETIVSSMK